MKKAFAPILFLLSFQLQAQGPWAPGIGHGYGQLLFNIVPTYTDLYDGGGNTRTLEREITDITLAAYAEVGITKRFTLGANLPWVMVQSGAASEGVTPLLPEGSLSQLGNISLFGKYTLIDQSLKVAIITQVDLPTSDREASTGLSTGVDATTIQPKVSVGGGLSKWFAYGFFGYGYRNNDHHDFLNFGVEGGLKASDNVTVILNINRWHNLDNGEDTSDSAANIETGLYTSFQEYNAVLLKAFVENLYQGLGAFLSVGGGSGTSVAASPALSLGVFYKW